ncbi:MAG TPA: signal peptidase II [Gemmatimonadaceae bacterium]|nr:signal peptidase II [Gemmatimonadaceae bacterium]
MGGGTDGGRGPGAGADSTRPGRSLLTAAARPSRRPPHPALFAGLVAGVLAADLATKAAAVERLVPLVPRPVLGDVLRWRLTYNRGMAFGLGAGAASRLIFSAAAVAIVVYLVRLWAETVPGARVRVAALALVVAGALGNLLDRLRSAKGVVDFIDVGVGAVRFWTFNIADASVTVGAILLAWVFMREDRDLRA